MPFQRQRIAKPDGRQLWYYSWDRPLRKVERIARAPALESEGLALRWNPLVDEWVIVAPQRQGRTFLPPDKHCPLCPTRDRSRPTEVPSAGYEIAVFENRFPSLRPGAPRPASARAPFATERALGGAEVVLYTSDHKTTLGELPEEHLARLVDVWADRYEELAARRDVAYVLIFENRGKEIGVTLTHPHGQIYAFPFVPPHAERELAAVARYRRANGRCLHCDIVAAETKAGERVVAENERFLAFVPHFARLPYEVHVAGKRHASSLLDLTAAERQDLARVLKVVLQKYDNLWDFPMPFVMVIHQRPTDGRRYAGCHLHFEFTPPYRSRDRLKYLAGCETGAGTFINDVLPELAAAQLRRTSPRT